MDTGFTWVKSLSPVRDEIRKSLTQSRPSRLTSSGHGSLPFPTADASAKINQRVKVGNMFQIAGCLVSYPKARWGGPSDPSPQRRALIPSACWQSGHRRCSLPPLDQSPIDSISLTSPCILVHISFLSWTTGGNKALLNRRGQSGSRQARPCADLQDLLWEKCCLGNHASGVLLYFSFFFSAARASSSAWAMAAAAAAPP